MITRCLLIGMILPTLALAQNDLQPRVGSPDNPATMNMGAVDHSSREGDFRITFPIGCSKVVTKAPNEIPLTEDGVPGVVAVLTYCDRYQEKGEGCSVTSYFNVRGTDTDYPGPQQVVVRVEEFLKTMEVKITRETPIHKILPDNSVIEGMDVYASDASGVGEVWIRGLLYEGDIYVIAAWKSTGELWNDPDYITYFNSFQPGAE
jgi:hypothetical protein